MKEKKTSGTLIKIIIVVFVLLVIGLFLLIIFSDDDEDESADKTAVFEYQSGIENADYTSGKKSNITDSGKAYGDPNTSWTVMLYLCGTDLESWHGFASVNLDEICAANMNDNVNFIIEAGGTKKWQT